MVVLRATQRVLRLLPSAESSPSSSDTALGDWYVNRLVIDRRPLLLLVSSESLLALLVPSQDVRSLPSRLADLVAERLRRFNLPEHVVQSEVAAMDPVVVSRTTSRSVLGSMVDFAYAIPHYPGGPGWGDVALRHAEDMLADTPCRASTRYSLWPRQRAPELLMSRWNSPQRS